MITQLGVISEISIMNIIHGTTYFANEKQKNTYPMLKTEAVLGLQQHPRWSALW